MVIYIEACFSGGFGENLAANQNVHMMTASDKHLTSKATNCFEDAIMKYENGKPIADPWEEGNCINDVFSYNWMQELMVLEPEKTLDDLFEVVKPISGNQIDLDGKITRPGSPVNKWGDMTMGSEKVTDHLGVSPDATLTSSLKNWFAGNNLSKRKARW